MLASVKDLRDLLFVQHVFFEESEVQVYEDIPSFRIQRFNVFLSLIQVFHIDEIVQGLLDLIGNVGIGAVPRASCG